MKATSLIANLQLKRLSKEIAPTLEIKSITQDTREIKAGSLFVCISGALFDGHKFAQEAVEKGAVLLIAEKPIDVEVPVIYVANSNRAMAILADAFYEHPSQDFRVVGVTGTNGKTTITHLIDQIFRDHQEVTGVIGTMYRRIGDEIFETKNTTPDSLTLQKTFAEMRKKQVTTCAIEVSSHSLVQGRVWGTDFDIAVFTNLSQDHLEYHHTMEEYAHAKSLLFSQLGNVYQPEKPKFAILNVDDAVGRDFQKMTAAEIMTYGIEEKADFRATSIKITNRGTSFDLLFAEKSYPVHLQLAGKFNVLNALAAIATAYVAGIELDSIICSLESIAGVRGRFELVQGEQDFAVVVDYAHTPDGLLNVLNTINEFKTGNVYCVVGCGGDRDKTKRPKMARIAMDYADHVIFTSDNPRTEDPATILEDVVAELGAEEEYQLIVDRHVAIEEAVKQAQKNDVILIAGKGHEDYQIIGTTKHHFDDVEEAKKAIATYYIGNSSKK
ncbi:UDP-N-acetylmuramoyl-L-alanyl-D-glutamate--2,6-diaminopimelate ligase [Carnobacterium gallinarum]|uniref:UDP-N-acetylmuramoyl-L-alanyl-D-glutamate--2, 6-diaminopimelate ligase n=1 Tax=Carnobacterium gallinarum TaxID=2749 RepID=UPI00055650E6|nr:UDP-N-acetylmuramoyl-L-alanyl-D-glutamate--2,6-diaminopimelate ligase [Carnobacterium gallinarum]